MFDHITPEFSDQALVDYLGQYITESKKRSIERVLAKRTRFFTLVLEDIFKPHNASAVLRTCDCFGVQDIHLIEKTDQYKINPFVTRGASQWVDLHKYVGAEGKAEEQCFSHLRSLGYLLFATSPAPSSTSIYDFPIRPDQKIALVFGNEHEGVSPHVVQQADGLLHIPMQGFTESFNVSVAASIFLYELTKQASQDPTWNMFLTENEKHELRLKWYRQIVPHSEIHEKEFRKRNLA
ncbi:MAG: TrmH family RNA methyltransferase [Algoriphagus sp.]